jgi:predicted  nucleic acid-binding Zn-ribbon protein
MLASTLQKTLQKESAMNRHLEQLIALQLHDVEARRLRDALVEAPKRVATAEAALKKAQAAVADTNKKLAEEEALRRRCESDADDRRNKALRLRKQMDTATNTTQVTALEHEIAFCEAALAALDNDAFASMERTETLEATLAAATAQAEGAAATLDTTREQSARSIAEDTATLAEVETQRAALRSELMAANEKLLAQYDRVAKARGTGVSEAVDHKCAACQMMVRPQRWNDLTGRDFEDAIFTCETCGRILYYDPRRDAPTTWRPGAVTQNPLTKSAA